MAKPAPKPASLRDRAVRALSLTWSRIAHDIEQARADCDEEGDIPDDEQIDVMIDQVEGHGSLDNDTRDYMRDLEHADLVALAREAM